MLLLALVHFILSAITLSEFHVSCLLVSCLLALIFLFFYFKGQMLNNSFVRDKNVKRTDSYDLIYLSTWYVQLLFRCSYSIGSSADC